MGEAAGGTSDFYRHPRSDLGWLVNQLFALAGQRTGHSLKQFAETINRRLGRPAVTPHMLEEWGCGRGLPPPDVLVAALQVAGADLPHLIESLRSGVDPATVGDVAGAAESPDLVPYDEGDSGPFDVKRRHFLQYLAMSGGATAGTEQLQLTLEALERLGRALASTCRVDAATIQYLEERVAGYWQDYYATRLPALDLLPYARTDLDTVSNLLNRSLAPAVRLRLCAVAARAATVVGALVWDTGKYGDARGVFRTAVEAAREAREPGAEAVALAWTSLGWTYDSQTPERRKALHAAQAGRNLCPAASVLGGWLASIEAEVHANEADRSACLAALRDAQRAADLPAAGEEWYWSRYDQAGSAGFRGVCMLKLDMTSDAQRALTEAIGLLDQSERHRRLTYLIDLARASARSNALEEACSYAREAFRIATDAKSPVKVQRLQPVRQTLHLHRDAQCVRLLEEEMSGLTEPAWDGAR